MKRIAYWSQSLRKSGQFLSDHRAADRGPGYRRNPFVNQVSFFATSQGAKRVVVQGRNPFVNQVSFF